MFANLIEGIISNFNQMYRIRVERIGGRGGLVEMMVKLEETVFFLTEDCLNTETEKLLEDT